MSEKSAITKSIAAAVGIAFASSAALSATAVADDNPFAMTDLDSGYMLASSHGGEEGKCGEGKCGEKGEEGACGEKGEEGKCGEGKCGGDKDEEGKCGGHSS